MNKENLADIPENLNYIRSAETDNLNDIGTQECEVLKHSMSEQMSSLRQEVMDITEKLHSNNTLLHHKEEANKELKEKLAALEIAVESLYDSSNKAGCCSGSCELF